MSNGISGAGVLKPVTTIQETDQRNEKVLKAARLYESQFLREMVRAMRKTVPENELVPLSGAEKIYREQMDDHYVDEWTNRGGVGMADMIYDQIMERFSNHVPKGSRAMARPQGPIPDGARGVRMRSGQVGPGSGGQVPAGSSNVSPAGDRSIAKPPREFSGKAGGPLSFQFEVDKSPQSRVVCAPWEGRVLTQFTDGQNTQVLIGHANGLQSALSFQGQTLLVGEGQTVSAGQEIGQASATGQSIVWKINGSV